MSRPLDELLGIERSVESVKEMAFADPRYAIRSAIVTEVIRQLHVALRGPEAQGLDEGYRTFVRAMRLLNVFLPDSGRSR